MTGSMPSRASGPTAWWSVLGGLLAMLLGLFLLAGLLLPRRERLVIIREDEAGRIAARRRPYAQVAEVLAQQERGVTRAKARVRPSWRGRGGSLELTATRTPLADEADVERRVGRGVEPLAQAAGLRMQIRSRLGTGRDRVEQMFRQRLRGRVSRLGVLGEIVVVVAALACLWYGLMVVLLSVKVSPGSVETISGYRAIFDYLAGLQPDDVDGRFRLIAGLSGLAVFLVCITLGMARASSPLPRPLRPGADRDERGHARGRTAHDRARRRDQCQATRLGNRSGRSLRFLTKSSPSISTLTGRRDRTMRSQKCRKARRDPHRHGLPDMPVSVTLAGSHRKTRRGTH